MTKPEKSCLVTFRKTVVTSYGNDKDIVRQAIEVSATDEQDALTQAKHKFCAENGLR